MKRMMYVYADRADAMVIRGPGTCGSIQSLITDGARRGRQWGLV